MPRLFSQLKHLPALFRVGETGPTFLRTSNKQLVNPHQICEFTFHHDPTSGQIMKATYHLSSSEINWYTMDQETATRWADYMMGRLEPKTVHPDTIPTVEQIQRETHSSSQRTSSTSSQKSRGKKKEEHGRDYLDF